MYFRTPSRARRLSRPRLGIERLEPRLPLAGDVTVALTDGTLTIMGDVQGNQIWVTQRGDMTVVSPSPWEMNGATRIRFGASVGMPRVQFAGVHAVVVDLRGGNDALVMGSLESDRLDFRALTVNLGAGDDSMLAQNMIVDEAVTVRAGAGADSVTVALTTTAGKLDVGTGVGDDRVSLDTVSGPGSVLLDTGDGNDHVNVRGGVPGPQSLAVNLGNGQNDAAFINVSISGPMTVTGGTGTDFIETRIVDVHGPLTINAGDGNNKLKMRSTSAESGQVTTGQGVDQVSIDASGRYTNTLRVRTGAGADTVSILSIEAGAIDLDLGAGNDRILLGGNRFHRRLRFDGGLGVDTVRYVAGELGTKFFTGFEVVEPIMP